MTAEVAAQPPRLEFLLEARVKLGELTMAGSYADGHERGFLSLLGGEFDGPGLRGTILPSTKDWPVYYGNGVRATDVDYVYLTDDGAYLFVKVRGYRYDRAQLDGGLLAAETMELAPNPHRAFVDIQAPQKSRYEWLSHNLFVGIGGQGAMKRADRTAVLRIYRLL